MREKKNVTYEHLANGDTRALKNGKPYKVIRGTNAWKNPRMKHIKLITEGQIEILRGIFAEKGYRFQDAGILNFERNSIQRMITEYQRYGDFVTTAGKAFFKSYQYGRL